MKTLDFKYQYIRKSLVQEQQFYQWLQILFRLNIEINDNYNHNSADLLIIKVFEFLNEGKKYCENIIHELEKVENNKQYFFKTILDFIELLNQKLTEEEQDFIEYKRHNICHIFQNGYEEIQQNLKVKTHLKKRKLTDIIKNLDNYISSEENEFEVQKSLFKKYFNDIEKLRTDLIQVQNKYNC